MDIRESRIRRLIEVSTVGPKYALYEVDDRSGLGGHDAGQTGDGLPPVG
jgi:hypothetical protein